MWLPQVFTKNCGAAQIPCTRQVLCLFGCTPGGAYACAYVQTNYVHFVCIRGLCGCTPGGARLVLKCSWPSWAFKRSTHWPSWAFKRSTHEVSGILAWALCQWGSACLAPVSKPGLTYSVCKPRLTYTGRGSGFATHPPSPLPTTGVVCPCAPLAVCGHPLCAHHSCWCTTSHCTAECSGGGLGDVHVNLCGSHSNPPRRTMPFGGSWAGPMTHDV